LVNEPTIQLFEQGIVATFLFVQVRTDWIREITIKIKDVHYYYHYFTNNPKQSGEHVTNIRVVVVGHDTNNRVVAVAYLATHIKTHTHTSA
jgi:hypothetical protein